MDTATAYRQALTDGDLAEAHRLELALEAEQAAEQLRRQKPDYLVSAALWYAQHGHPVFPIHEAMKIPATRNGFKDATVDPDRIRSWWSENIRYNIGLPTGHAFDVWDIDSDQGMRGVYWGDPAPYDSLIVMAKAATSRDHGQHIYVPVTGRGNGTAILPGVDYRGLGGYVVAPPSVGANGRRYEWNIPLPAAHVCKAAAA